MQNKLGKLCKICPKMLEAAERYKMNPLFDASLKKVLLVHEKTLNFGQTFFFLGSESFGFGQHQKQIIFRAQRV